MNSNTRHISLAKELKQCLGAQPVRALAMQSELLSVDYPWEKVKTKSIFLHGTHNVDFLAQYLKLLGYLNYIEFHIEVSGYDQRYSQIHNKASNLFVKPYDYICLLTSWRSLLTPFLQNQTPVEFVSNYVGMLSNVQESTESTIIVQNYEFPIKERNYLNASNGIYFVEYLRLVNQQLNNALRDKTVEYCIDVNQISSWLGQDNWHDKRLWYTTRQPLTPLANGILAETIVGVVKNIVSPEDIKVLICDLDNTLWGGTVSDDGLDGLSIEAGDPIGEVFLDFQLTIKNMKDNGLILAISSKNDPDQVDKVFSLYDHMPLKLSDFAAKQISWQRKSLSVREIISDLNVTQSSIAFMDDNPREIDEVVRSFPELKTILLNGDPVDYETKLASMISPKFTGLTEEDKARTQMYHAKTMRENRLSEYGDHAEYLESLDIQVDILPLSPNNITRATQLINKTNQFNISLQRHSTTSIEQLLSQGDYKLYSCRQIDCYGDNGLISVLIFHTIGEVIQIENWVMSCRVFDLGIESAFLKCCLDSLAKNNNSIETKYLVSDTNKYAKRVVEKLGFNVSGITDKWITYRCLASDIEYLSSGHILVNTIERQ
jgi:FkbH-like protein